MLVVRLWFVFGFGFYLGLSELCVFTCMFTTWVGFFVVAGVGCFPYRIVFWTGLGLVTWGSCVSRV